MPNWCSNRIIIEGTINSIFKFKETIDWNNEDSDKIFQFQQTVPMPSNFDDKGWYEWRLSHWGTKWDIDRADIYVENTRIEITGWTAWSPPEAWAKAVSNKFAGLTITVAFCEQGMQFYGYSKYKDGECIDEMSSNFDSDYKYDEEKDEVITRGSLNRFLGQWEIVDMGG